jgi:VWFA-related protein
VTGRGIASTLAASLALGPAFAQEPPVVPAFPAKAEAVTVDVVVLDASGRPVRDLSKADFTLLEDGRPQTIVGFQTWEAAASAEEASPAPAPPTASTSERRGSASGRAFALVIDDLGLDPIRSGADVKRAATRWLEEKADPRDLLTILTTSGDVWWSDLVGSGREDLLAVLGRVNGKKQAEPATEQISDWEAYRISEYETGTVSSEDPLPGDTTSCLNQGLLAGASIPPSVEDRVVARWFGNGGCRCTSISGPNGNAAVVATSIRSCRSQVRVRARQVQEGTTRHAQAVFGAVERLSRGLAGCPGRKSIIVLSEGLIRDTHLGALERAIDASQRGNTAVYFVDAKGLVGESFYGAQNAAPPAGLDMAAVTSEETLLSSAGTEYVAEATGGSTLRDTNDLVGGLQRLADESSAYYLLGYQSDRPRDGKWRKLEVRVSRPGCTVRARRGFSTSATPVPPAPAKGRRVLDPAAMAGGERGEIPLRSAAYVLDGDDAGGTRILVALEVDTSKLTFEGSGEQRTATLDLTLVGVSRDRPKVFPVDERVKLSVDAKAVGGWWVLSREIHLPAGVAQTRILVRDTASDLTGSVMQRFEVPGITGPFLASPILTDRLVTSPSGEQRLVPIAHRVFRSPARLYCGYDVHGAAKAVVGYELRRGGGQPVSEVPPAPVSMDANGRTVGLLALPIDDLADGPYELVLNVEDAYSGRSMQAREPFVLERGP